MDVQSAVGHAAQSFGLQDVQFMKLAMLVGGLFLAYKAVTKTYRGAKAVATGTASLVAKQKFALRNVVAGAQAVAGLTLIGYAIGETISWCHLPKDAESAKHLLDFSTYSLTRATTAIGSGIGSLVLGIATCDSEANKRT